MARKIKIAATSDWHGTLPEIPKCDLLLIAGDIVPKEDQDSLRRSLMWFEGTFIPHIKKTKCKKCIFTAGNHDFFLTTEMFSYINAIIAYHGLSKKIIYLLDETYEYRGLKIYGCPWTASLQGGPSMPAFLIGCIKTYRKALTSYYVTRLPTLKTSAPRILELRKRKNGVRLT